MGDITKHISWSEVECHCGCGEKSVNLIALQRFEKFIEEHLDDAPVVIDRLCSCAAHNAAIKGTPHSHHLSYTPKDTSPEEAAKALEADAIDIGSIGGMSIEAARVIAHLYWDGGIEENIPWLHIDCGQKRVFSK